MRQSMGNRFRHKYSFKKNTDSGANRLAKGELHGEELERTLLEAMKNYSKEVNDYIETKKQSNVQSVIETPELPGMTL